MARPAKLEVAALSIRIQNDKPRDYTGLILDICGLKTGMRIHGEKYLALSNFNEESGFGRLAKYSEIDVDGDWFDIEAFDVADPESVEDVSIPEKLRPNLAIFEFFLDRDNHLLIFETYADSKTLSANSVEKFFKAILSKEEIESKYGKVEADVVKSIDEVDKILSLPMLKELTVSIRRPNSDGLPEDVAADIEERLAEQNGEEYVEGLKSRDHDGLKPNERTKKLAYVASENGDVSAKSVKNGISVWHETKEKPMKEMDTYSKDDTHTTTVFRRLTERIRGRILAVRKRITE
ncbi:DUF4747 family protein [Salibaculum halophilum]|uniref:DUF4747 family protein n=1 Tax=Salibaculum halophilum TaxID=1914408 RepID=UPI000A1166A3|nr:DUF4747 family protein [Salibaculum halophilum]